MRSIRTGRGVLLLSLAVTGALLGGAGSAALGLCGPFSDVTDATFCPFVLEIFTLGITTGTTPTTYDPASPVSRLQMAAFLSRTVDGVLTRGSRRAALDQFWTTTATSSLGLTTIGMNPRLVWCDGADVWVANFSGTVSRVRASDGRLLETWTGATKAFGVISAMGRVFVTGSTLPGSLYEIDPSQPAGSVTTVATNLGQGALGIAFDGSRIWVASGNSVSIVTPGPSLPWTATTVTSGFFATRGALYDGANIWIANAGTDALLRLDANGAILQTVTVGQEPYFPVFDGANIWLPNLSGSVSVVRASTGGVLATVSTPGPGAAAFDGERVLVTSQANNSVSLWKAADLTYLGSVSTGPGSHPSGVGSDGVNFWIAFDTASQVARF